MLQHIAVVRKYVLSVTGNCMAKQGAFNVLRLLKANEMSVPVHIGQSDTLVPLIKPKPCSEYHGKDGFGDVPDFYPTMNDVNMENLKSETAVQAWDLHIMEYTAFYII